MDDEDAVQRIEHALMEQQNDLSYIKQEVERTGEVLSALADIVASYLQQFRS